MSHLPQPEWTPQDVAALTVGLKMEGSTVQQNAMTSEAIRAAIHAESMRRHGVPGDEFIRRCHDEEFCISGDLRGLVALLGGAA